MRLLKIASFLIAPLFISSQENMMRNVRADEPRATSSQNSSEPDPILKSHMGPIKLPELTEEQKKALDAIEDFLEKYVGGNLDYSKIERLITGLQHDYKTINEEGEKMGFLSLEGMALRNYPNNIFSFNYERIQEEIAKKAYAEITQGLIQLGVDPATAKKVDNAQIIYLVTKGELERFRNNICITAKAASSLLPPNKKFVCRDGLSVEIIRFIRSRKLGLPPGVSIVNVEPNTQNIETQLTAARRTRSSKGIKPQEMIPLISVAKDTSDLAESTLLFLEGSVRSILRF